MAPDLWLVDEAGSHRFIEVKLPKDEVSRGQIAGLAVIASSFVRPNLSVEIVELNPERELEFADLVQVIHGQQRFRVFGARAFWASRRFGRGGSAGSRVLVVAYTERGEEIRIIHARVAAPKERRTYGEKAKR